MSSPAEPRGATPAGTDETPPPEPGAIAALRRIDRVVARLEEAVLAVFLLVLLLVGVYGAYKRNVSPPSPFWADEVIRYTVFFIGLTAAALAAHADRLFNMDLFTRGLSLRGRLGMKIAAAIVTIGVCWIFFESSLVLRRSLLGEEGELLPPEIGVLSLPIAMALIMLHLAVQIVVAAYYLATGKTPPEMFIPKAGH
jgi:TRAP-type C4-dicarboxylate transport system permease small subunit